MSGLKCDRLPLLFWQTAQHAPSSAHWPLKMQSISTSFTPPVAFIWLRFLCHTTTLATHQESSGAVMLPVVSVMVHNGETVLNARFVVPDLHLMALPVPEGYIHLIETSGSEVRSKSAPLAAST